MAEIRARNLKVRRGGFELNIENLVIEEKSKVAILGENGSGKSTLLEALSGIAPYQGEILVNGIPAKKLNSTERARLVSLMPQTPVVAFNYTVFEVVLMGRYPWFETAPGKKDIEKTLKILEKFDLIDLKERRFLSLSGGERRRVIFARTVNQSAKIMLLDEPTSMVDVANSLRILEFVKNFPGTVVASMHDVNLALRFFEKIIFLKEGKVVVQKRSDEVDEKILSHVYSARAARSTAFVFTGRL